MSKELSITMLSKECMNKRRLCKTVKEWPMLGRAKLEVSNAYQDLRLRDPINGVSQLSTLRSFGNGKNSFQRPLIEIRFPKGKKRRDWEQVE